MLLSFLVFAFVKITKPLVVTAHYSFNPVLDITGKKLHAGTDYYILPAIRGSGGGHTLASTGNETCSLHVVQEQHEVQNGLPLTFSLVNIKKGVVRLSTDQNIKFSAASIFVQSTEWKLDSHDDTLEQWFVTTGGVEGNPGPGTTTNWFKIENFDDDYKLVFCPEVCDLCKVLGRDI